jgi:hypothetical protein
VQFRDATDAASLTCQPQERLVQATIKPGLNMCKAPCPQGYLGDSGQGEMRARSADLRDIWLPNDQLREQAELDDLGIFRQQAWLPQVEERAADLRA